MANKRNLTLIGILVASVGVIVFVWYNYLGGTSTSSTAVVAVGGGGTGDAAATVEVQSQTAQEILAAVQLIHSINLDTEFFNDPRFRSLEDVPYSIPPARPGGHTPLTQLFHEPSK